MNITGKVELSITKCEIVFDSQGFTDQGGHIRIAQASDQRRKFLQQTLQSRARDTAFLDGSSLPQGKETDTRGEAVEIVIHLHRRPTRLVNPVNSLCLLSIDIVPAEQVLGRETSADETGKVLSTTTTGDEKDVDLKLAKY